MIPDPSLTFPSEKQDTVRNGIVYLRYYDPSPEVKEEAVKDMPLLEEGALRAGVPAFYARFIAEKLFDYIRPNPDKILSFFQPRAQVFSGRSPRPLEPNDPLYDIKTSVPARKLAKLVGGEEFYRRVFNSPDMVTGFNDPMSNDLLQKMIPFFGNSKSARMIWSELYVIIKSLVDKIDKRYELVDDAGRPIHAKVMEKLPHYLNQVLNTLIKSNTWPPTQLVAAQIYATTLKASAYESRVKAGLDLTARSVLVAYETQVEEAKRELAEDFAQASNATGARKARLMRAYEKKKAKINIHLEKERKQANNVFMRLMKQSLASQKIINPVLREQQIREAREASEGLSRQMELLGGIKESIFNWSSGVIFSKSSDQIRTARAKQALEKINILNPAAFFMDMWQEFTQTVRTSRNPVVGVVKGAAAAIGSKLVSLAASVGVVPQAVRSIPVIGGVASALLSPLTLLALPFLAMVKPTQTLTNLAIQQKESHDQMAVVARSEVKPIFSGNKVRAYATNVPDEDDEDGPIQGMSPSVETPSSALEELTNHVKAQLSNMIEDTRDNLQRMIINTSKIMGEYILKAKAENNQLEMEDWESIIVDEMSDAELKKAADGLNVDLSKDGRIKKNDWVTILRIIKTVSKKIKEQGANFKLDIPWGLLSRFGRWGLLGALGGAAISTESNTYVRRRTEISALAGRDITEQSTLRRIEEAMRLERERVAVRQRVETGEGDWFDRMRYNIDRNYYTREDTRAARLLRENNIPPPRSVESQSKFSNIRTELGDHTSIGE